MRRSISVGRACSIVLAFAAASLSGACGDRAGIGEDAARHDAPVLGQTKKHAAGAAFASSDPTAPIDALATLNDPDLALFKGDLDAMRQRGVLRVLVVPGRTDFFLDSGEIKGIQTEFVAELEQHLNADAERESDRLRIKFVPVAFDELLPALIAGKGDIAAAFLSITPERKDQVAFAAPLRKRVEEVVVTHTGADALGRLDALAGRTLYVLRDSSYVEHLRGMNTRLRAQGREPIDIELAAPRLSSDEILELVNAGVVAATVVDGYKARLWARVLPNIVVHSDLAIAEGNKVSWAVRRDADDLLEALAGFVANIRQGSLLGNMLFQRYFNNTRWIDDPLARGKRDQLQRYIGLFNTYGARYGFDPLALAAQAYQESQLDHSARSDRGAVGIMQLLPSTARDPQVGIPNIASVENNIHAGAKYLAFLRDRYFASADVTRWNSRALAWAAYNAGPRNIRQARREAERLGLNPNVWFDNVELATGRIVGREPVRYVANIYKYFVAYRLALNDGDANTPGQLARKQ